MEARLKTLCTSSKRASKLLNGPTRGRSPGKLADRKAERGQILRQVHLVRRAGQVGQQRRQAQALLRPGLRHALRRRACACRLFLSARSIACDKLSDSVWGAAVGRPPGRR